MAWYQARGGLKFECTGCGECCRRPGHVEFTPIDITRVSAHLEMSEAAFRHKYLIWDHGSWRVEVIEGDPCTFLVGDHCTIHEVKPIQCRTYPFWPELLEHRYAWSQEAKSCEGINRGPRHSPEEIEARRLPED